MSPSNKPALADKISSGSQLITISAARRKPREFVELTAVDRDDAGARLEDHASDCGLALAGRGVASVGGEGQNRVEDRSLFDDLSGRLFELRSLPSVVSSGAVSSALVSSAGVSSTGAASFSGVVLSGALASSLIGKILSG